MLTDPKSEPASTKAPDAGEAIGQDALARHFAPTREWIFDLDNTLYPSTCNLFAEVDRRMGAFIARLLDVDLAKARRIQKDYYYRYGTTLAGLMQEHGLAPETFLDYVHDIDLSPVEAAPALARVIARLPGRKLIFTNGSRRHGERVAAKLGILDLFDDIFDIAASGYVPKPQPQAYAALLEAHGVAPDRAAMFEDLPHNLEAPHALGMRTVLVHSHFQDHPAQRTIGEGQALPAHIHHVTDDLARFLDQVAPASSEPDPAA